MGRDMRRVGRLRLLRTGSALPGALLLAACGGGGGGVSSPGTSAPPTSTPAPAPTPPPTTPVPTPPAPDPAPTTSADGGEYKASGAVVSARAAYAYDRGITGRGVTVAVLDTGVNRATPEFAGRVSPDSTGFEQSIARCGTCAPEAVPPFPIDDREGHGTEVASVALAARNGSGVQGVAPDATLLMLKIVGPDFSGVTAGSTDPVREGGQANPGLIAPALRYAVDKGAFVSVLSLNGTAGGQVAADQRAAMDAVRGADRLVVESVSNATGEDSFTGQIAQNLVGADRANADWFLFAVGVDRDGTPRAANGSAGPLADRMLAAGGNSVQVVTKDGGLATVTGNSFAAPAVAGAAALLKQYWPQLGGKAIARILLDTATDAGTPGVDPVFGAGVLNVERAMQAQAPAASFSSAAAVLARWSSLTVSAPFGGAETADALTRRVGSMTVLDRYGRDYRMRAASGVRSRGSGLLAGGMLPAANPVWAPRPAGVADARLGIASAPVGPWQGTASARPAVVSFSPAPGQVATLSANAALGQGRGLAGSPLRSVVSAPVGVSSSWSGRGWSAALSSGTSRDARASLRSASVSTPLGLGLELSDLVERGRVLGMSDAGSGTARTTMVTLTARREVAGVLVTGRATAARTRAGGGFDLLRFTGPVASTAFAVEGARGLLGGVATLGLSSPLQVERARAVLLAPVAYDLITGALATERVAVVLAPSARELDLELGWSAALSPGSALRLGLARAFDAGNAPGASGTAGFLSLTVR